MKLITSRDNQIIKETASLKMHKHRRQEGLFLLEGERLLQELTIHTERLVRYFVQNDQVEKFRWFIDKIGTEQCYLIPERVMKHICDTAHPQGLAAVASINTWNLDTVAEQKGLWILMNSIADPGNVGTIIRSCWALGGQGVMLTADCADPYSPKVCRASMGGILNLPLIEKVELEDLRKLREAGFSLVGTAINGEYPYYQADLKKDLVLLVGSEARGLDADLLQICDEILIIPMKEGVNSLNAASACAIILSEAWRQKCGG